MIISLKNVRSHKNREFTFIDRGISLVKGESGSGKSSLFEAIAWCLYKKVKDIYENKNEKTIVSINFTTMGMIITRQRNPGLLTVNIGNASYVDQEAQEMIYLKFGQRETWVCSSYMEQGERCILLSSPNAIKMEILNQISFSCDNPAMYIVKIDEKINRTNGELQHTQTKFAYDCQLLQNDINQSGVDGSKYLNLEQRDKLNVERQELHEKVTVLKKEISEYHQLKGKKQSLENSQTTIINSISNIASVNQSELLENENRIDQIQRSLHKLKQEQEAIKQIEDMRSYLKRNVEEHNFNIKQHEEKITKHETESNSQLERKAEEHRLELKQRDEIIDRQINEGIRQLEKNINDYKSQVDHHERQLSNLLSQSTETKNQIESFDQQLERFSHLTEDEKQLNENDLARVKQELLQYQEMTGLAIRLNCNYDEQSIKDEIIRCQTILDQQPLIETLKQIGKLRDSIYSKYEENKQLMSLSSDDIIKCQHKINEIQSSLEITQCPHCQKGLRINAGKIVADLTVIHTHQDLENAKIELQNLMVRYQEGAQLRNLKSQLESMVKCLNILDQVDDIFIKNEHPIISSIQAANNAKTMTIEEINQMKNRVTELNKIKILSPSQIDQNKIEEAIARNQLIKRHEGLLMMNQKILDMIKIQVNNLDNAKKIYEEWLVKPDNYKIEQEKMKEETLAQIKKNYEDWVINFKKSEEAQLERNIESLNNAKEKYQEWVTKLSTFEAEQKSIDKLSTDLSDLKQMENEIINLQKKNNQIREAISQKKILEEQFQSIILQLSEIRLNDNLEEELEKNNQRILEIDQLIQNGTKIDQINQRSQQLTLEQTKINELVEKIKIYHEMKKIAIETEYNVLESAIASINLAMENITQHIFNEPATIIMQTHKLLATTKQTKPEINMKIILNGKEYNSINKLSYGQRDRVSMAVMLALSKINGCPFIIFDETLAHISSSLKEACVNAIRAEIGHKLVICAQHDGTEGYFDQTINIPYDH